MDRKVCPAQHHPSPHRGVEGSRRDSTDQVTPTHPCPPASLPGVVGRSSRRAGPQQLHSAPHCSPSRTAPTWADIARWGNLSSTHQEAPATPTADAIALYKRFVSMGLQAIFSIRGSAGYEEVNLFCHFLEPSAVRHHSTQRHQCRRNRQQPVQPAPKQSPS
jgi:hypothetical protein